MKYGIKNDDDMELKQWLDEHNITYSISKDILYVRGWGRALIQDGMDHVFKTDRDGKTVFNCLEGRDYLVGDDIYYIVFSFGDRWYYIDIRDSKEQFRVLRFVGECQKGEIDYEYYPLGIHSGYELLNGSGLLCDWADKVSFLGFKGMGTCEYNTFAASLDLQNIATARGLKYCFGYSLTMEVGGAKVDCKVYASTQRGFSNILRIQKAINVDREDGMISHIELMKHASGNCLVFGKLSGTWMAAHDEEVEDIAKAFGGSVYYQVDLSEYAADKYDKEMLESTKAWFDAYYIAPHEYKNGIRPVLIQDAYYIDADNYKNKIILNKVDIGTAHELSYNQYMKTLDEMHDEFNALFSDKYGDDVFEDMCSSTVEIMGKADARYDLTENYAPQYELTDEEKLVYGTAHNMFNELIEEGFKKLVPKGREEIYRERLEYEKYVIESTNNVHYYLITWDEVNYARRQGQLVGIGRGSAGGCLLSYLLGITNIDPIRWGLLFERFLLPERGGLSPSRVTKFCDDVLSSRYVEIKSEEGDVYRFDSDARFLVNRDGKEMSVYADELVAGDDIVWDRRDEIFTLNERKYDEGN